MSDWSGRGDVEWSGIEWRGGLDGGFVRGDGAVRVFVQMRGRGGVGIHHFAVYLHYS